MAAIESTMLALGTRAPEFALQDVLSGRLVTLDSFAGKQGLLVMFICRHCPYVQHVEGELARIGQDYAARNVGIVAIMPNDVEQYPADGPEGMCAQAEARGFNFPYLYDQSQAVARAYDAACTPDFFLFDAELALVYRGQLDDSRPKNDTPVTGRDLRAALDAMLEGTPISTDQRPSMGCSIKWRMENLT